MLRHFMQTVFLGYNQLEMSKPVFWKKSEKISSVFRLLNLRRVVKLKTSSGSVDFAKEGN